LEREAQCGNAVQQLFVPAPRSERAGKDRGGLLHDCEGNINLPQSFGKLVKNKSYDNEVSGVQYHYGSPAMPVVASL